MRRVGPGLAVVGVATAALACSAPASAQPTPEQVKDVLRQLNDDKSVKGSEDIKSYKILFDAYLKMTPPPRPVDESFNLTTIHPKMADWPAVSSWAEANAPMAEAIKKCKTRKIVGLPYGEDSVDARYREARLVAAVGLMGYLRQSEVPYARAQGTIAAFATAETYRLMEAGRVKDGLDLAIANLYVLRQFCDRLFITEKEYSIWLLNQALSNVRDVFFLYQDKISIEQFTDVSKDQIPTLLLVRRRLELPEGDRIVAEALIKSMFDEKEQPDPAKFAATFGAVQAADQPLTLFGAAKRWEQVAAVHAGWPASRDKLKIVYDDWWRRWQLLSYEPVLDMETEYERTNPVRYAVVTYSLKNIDDLFALRDQLVASINGTAIAAGLCAYKRKYDGAYPNDLEKLYGAFVRKFITDNDPYDVEYGAYKYRLVEKRTSIDTPAGRLWIEDPKAGLLYARGQDHRDNRGARHTDEGAADSDIVFWPPIKALSRQQGLIQ